MFSPFFSFSFYFLWPFFFGHRVRSHFGFCPMYCTNLLWGLKNLSGCMRRLNTNLIDWFHFYDNILELSIILFMKTTINAEVSIKARLRRSTSAYRTSCRRLFGKRTGSRAWVSRWLLHQCATIRQCGLERRVSPLAIDFRNSCVYPQTNYLYSAQSGMTGKFQGCHKKCL